MRVILFISTSLLLIVTVFFVPELLLNIIVGNTTLTIIISMILKKNDLHTKKFFTAILSYLSVISFFSVLCYYDSIAIGTISKPYIPQPDAKYYYSMAMDLSKGNPLRDMGNFNSNYMGYQILLAYTFKIFGQNLLNGIILNYSLITLSIVYLSACVKVLTKNRDIAFSTLIAGIFVTPFFTIGLITLKDPLFVFGFSLFLYAMARLLHIRFSILSLMLSVFAIIIVGIGRLPFIFIFPINILILQRSVKLNGILGLTLIIAFIAFLFPFFSNFSSEEIGGNTITETILETDIIGDHEHIKKGLVTQLVGDYANSPIWYRLLTIPLAVFVQFVTPVLFWSNSFLNDHIWYFAHHQLHLVWYGCIGLFIFISLLRYKRIKNSNIRYLFLFGLLFYVGVAFSFGGTIPRYAVPSIVFFVPAFGYMIYLYKHDLSIRMKIIEFFKRYYMVSLLLFVLFILYKYIF